MECTSELDINSSVFLTTNNNNDNMYCECSGRVLNFGYQMCSDAVGDVFTVFGCAQHMLVIVCH